MLQIAGGNALRAASEPALLTRIQVGNPGISRVRVSYLHLIDSAQPITPSLRELLEALLSYGPRRLEDRQAAEASTPTSNCA